MIAFVFCVLVLAVATASVSSAPPEPQVRGRITNGFYASVGQTPWTVRIELNDVENGWFCGGTIISNIWVLTAAHCTEKATEAELLFGSASKYRTTVKQTVTKANFYQHPKFVDVGLGDDIALIKLNSPLAYSPKINKVKLASATNDPRSYEKEKVLICGWGLDELYRRPDTASCGEILITNKTACTDYYGTTGEFICADTSNNVSTCVGDSGSGAIDQERKEVVGIVSYGDISSCTNAKPIGLTYVPFFANWIRSITGIY